MGWRNKAGAQHSWQSNSAILYRSRVRVFLPLRLPASSAHRWRVIDQVDNEKGVIEKWSVEMGGVGKLSRVGWRKDTVKLGDEITLIGKPSKEGKPSMF